jgi:hypothetical protein
MRLKIVLWILFISFIAIASAGASGGAITNTPSITGNIGSGCPFFFYTTTIMTTSYLSGNSDVNSGSQDTTYLQTAIGAPGVQADSEAPQGTPNTLSENPSRLVAADEVQPGVSIPENAFSTFSENPSFFGSVSGIQRDLEVPVSSSGTPNKVPFWLIIGFLVIDIPISLMVLYLALTKKI